MIGANVARRYAKALLEIGVETGALNALVVEIDAIAGAYEASAELRGLLDNPLVPAAAKRAVLAEVADRASVGPVVKSTLFLLADRRRLHALPAVAALLREMGDLREGVLRAEVTTAARLDEGYYARLQQRLEKMTGKRVVLDRREDPSLIAGVITRIGDVVVDGSLRARLDEMAKALLPN